MSQIERFKQFMTEVDWEELTIGEKETLYEATRGVPYSVAGFIRVEYVNNDEEKIVLTHIPSGVSLKVSSDELIRFRKWIEDTYMYGEEGDSYLAWARELERNGIQEKKYIYDRENLVLNILKRYFSKFSIGKGVLLGDEKHLYFPDYVIYDNKDNIQFVIEVKSNDISESKLTEVFGHVFNRYPKVVFILTDGSYAFIRKEGKIQKGAFLTLIKNYLVAEEKTFIAIDDIRKLFKTAINKAKQPKDKLERQKTEAKKTKLMDFVNSLQDGDQQLDEKDSSWIYLKEEKEKEFIQILLGEYLKNEFVKFTSSRTLCNMLCEGKIGMSSLVCMNDPSEKDYADKRVKHPKIMDNSPDTFIMSACETTKAKDLTIWRLYTDDTKGVGLIFTIDKTKLVNGFYLAPVSYEQEDGTHYELDIIKLILKKYRYNRWRFQLTNWQVWKHFFKKNIYAVEDEKRLIYIPVKENSLGESNWFIDDRTGVYTESRSFSLKQANAFPLTLNRVLLGTKFPSRDENVNQFNKRFKTAAIITNNQQDDIVGKCEIEDYR